MDEILHDADGSFCGQHLASAPGNLGVCSKGQYLKCFVAEIEVIQELSSTPLDKADQLPASLSAQPANGGGQF